MDLLLAKVGDADCRASLGRLGASEIAPEAMVVDLVVETIQAHFEATDEQHEDVGVGRRTYQATNRTLVDVLREEMQVPEDVAVHFAAEAGKRLPPSQWIANTTRRRAALQTTWDAFVAASSSTDPRERARAVQIADSYLDSIEVLAPSAVVSHDAGTALFRARAAMGDYSAFYGQLSADRFEALGAPPAAFAGAGRLNRQGEPCFYAAGDTATCLSEIRVEAGTLVVVAKFRLVRPLKMLDMRQLSTLDPRLSIFSPKYRSQAFDVGFLRGLPDEISAPSWPGEHAAHYLPTQLIADRVRARGFDGLIYESTQVSGGVNYAIFGKPGVADITLEESGAVEVVGVTVNTQPADLAIAGVAEGAP